MSDTPYPTNFCGCGFPDWLEVHLTPRCNGKCAWCVERNGFRPRYAISWEALVAEAIATGRQNIILLGGEPTLHPDFGRIVAALADAGRSPCVTTNGGLLTVAWVQRNLRGISKVNISVHHYDLAANQRITGIRLTEAGLRASIAAIKELGAEVRMNCNCIRGAIDSECELRAYARWARGLGAGSIRFAELKQADESFVDLEDVFGDRFGVNRDPFRLGCSCNGELEGMPINIRLMCGMQTRRRPCPTNPKRQPHPVLYYNGVMYDGWQQAEESDMTLKELEELLKRVASGEVTITEAAIAIDRAERKERVIVQKTAPEGGGYCAY